VTLVVDGMRIVRSFHMDRAAASVLTTCVCVPYNVDVYCGRCVSATSYDTYNAYCTGYYVLRIISVWGDAYVQTAGSISL
jgi:hypothetical protein